MTRSPEAASRADQVDPLELVPELRSDFLRRDIDGESVVWSAASPTPAVLDPVTRVMLDVIDGAATMRELAEDIHDVIGIPIEAAQQQVIRVVDQLEWAGVLTSSPEPAAAEPGSAGEIFVSPPTPCSENASRLGTVTLNLRFGSRAVRVACDSRKGARALRNALEDSIDVEIADAPLAFTLTAPQGFTRTHSLIDRAGFVLSEGRGLDAGLHALGSHLTALLPPAAGTVRIRARTLVAGDRTIACLLPLLYVPPITERDLRRAGVGMIDRLALDISVDTGRIANPDMPWSSLASLASAPHHLGTGGTRTLDEVVVAAPAGSAPPTPAAVVAQLAGNSVEGSAADLLDAAMHVVEGAELRASTPGTSSLLEELLGPGL